MQVPQYILDSLIAEEGNKDYVYTDSQGNLTAGVGHKLVGAELDQYQDGDKILPGDSTQWFENDASRAYEAALKQAEALGYGTDNEKFIERLTHTNFQLGENWWNEDVNPRALKKTWAALKSRDFDSAAKEAIDSEWFLQESGKDVNRAELFADSIKGLEAPTVLPPIEPTPDRRVASAGTDLSGIFLDSEARAIEAAGASVDYERTPFGEKAKPDSLLGKFLYGVSGGLEQASSDYNTFKAAANIAFGRDEAAQENLAVAQFYERQASEYLQQLTPFEDFYNNPTFAGGIEQVFGGVGKILPQAAETVASAIAGGGVGFILKETLKHSGKAAVRQMTKEALRKYKMAGGGTAGLKALSPEERVLLEESWKLGNRLVKGGGITGAFLQEYKVGTSQSLQEYQEAGRELGKPEAFAALGLGLPQAIVGTAAEVFFAKSLYSMALRKTRLGKIVSAGDKNPESLSGSDKALYTIYQKYQKGGQKALSNSELGKLQKAQKDSNYFSNFARDMATLVGISTVTEGTAEGIQEGITIGQRFAIDEDYDAADAKLRLAEATFLGAFAGGGVRAIPGAAATSIFRQARNALDDSFDYRARKEEEDSRIGSLSGFKPESESSFNAQLDTVLDSDNRKDTIFVREQDQGRYKNFEQRLKNTPNLSSITIPGQGTVYSTQAAKLNKFKPFQINSTGRNSDRFEATLAAALGYSEVRNPNHNSVLEVVNRKGQVVWQQSMDTNKRAEAVEAANTLFRKGGLGLRNYDEVFAEDTKAKPRANEKYFIRERDPETSIEERIASVAIEKVNEKEEEEEPVVRKSTIDDTDTDDFETAQAQAEGRDVDSPDTPQTEGLDFETQQQSAQTDKVRESDRGFVEVEGRPNEKGTVRLASTSGPQTTDAERGIKSKPQPVGSLKPIPLGALIPLDDPLRQKFKTKQLVKPYTQESIDNVKRAQQQVIDYLEGGKDNVAKAPLTPKKQAIVSSINQTLATFFLGLVKQNPDKNFDITQQTTEDGQVENRIVVEATSESRAFDQETALNIVTRGFNRADKYGNPPKKTEGEEEPNNKKQKHKRFPTGSPKGQQAFRWELAPAGSGQVRSLTAEELGPPNKAPIKPTDLGNRYLAMNELLKAARELDLQQDPSNTKDYNTSLVDGFNLMLIDVLQGFKVNGVRQHILFRKLDGTKFADGNDYIDITNLPTQTTPTEGTPDIQTDLDAVTNLINNKRQRFQERAKSEIAERKTRLEEEKEAALRTSYNTNEELVATVKRFDRQIAEVDAAEEGAVERALRGDDEIKAALEAIAAQTTVAARPPTQQPTAEAQDISNLPIWFDMFRQEQGEPAVYSTLRELNEIAPPEETEIAVAIKSLLGKIKQADTISIPNRAISVGKNSTESQNVDGNLVPTVPAVPMNPDIELTLVGREGIPIEFKLIQPKLNKDQYAFKDLPGMPKDPILRGILTPTRFSKGQEDPFAAFQFSRGDIIPSKENQEKIFILNFLESIQKGDEFRIPSITLNYVNNYLREKNFDPPIRRGVVREGVVERFVGGTEGRSMSPRARNLETVPLDSPPGDDVGPIRTMQAEIGVQRGDSPMRSVRKDPAETYDVNSKEYVLPGSLETSLTVRELGSLFIDKLKADVGPDIRLDLSNLVDIEQLAGRISRLNLPGGSAVAYESLSSLALEFGVNPEVVGSRDSFGEGMQLSEDSPGTSVLDVYGRMSGPTEIESSIIDSRPTDDLTITVDEQQDMADRAKEIKQQRRKTTPEIREVLAERRAGTIAIDDTIDGIDTRNQVFTESSSLKKMNAFMEKYKSNIKNFRGNRTALWFGKVPYSYTGTSHPALAMPKEMRDLASQLSEMFGYPPEYFNSVLINKYEKGAKIAAHRDDEPIFKTDDGNIGGIATISFGGNAAVTITDGKDSRTINTSNGSVYVMPEGRFQFLYKHEVGPAESQRISLTFRHLPEVEQIDDITKRNFEVVNKRFESATTVKDIEGNRVPLERFKFGRTGPVQFIPSKGAKTVRASERIKSFFREGDAKGGPSLIDVMARYVTKNLGYNKNTIILDAETPYKFTLAENAAKYRDPDSVESAIDQDNRLNARIQREQRELLQDENSTGKIIRFENANVIIIQKTPLQSETEANASQLRLLERRFKDLGHEFGHAFLWQELGVVFKKGDKVIGGLGDQGNQFVIQKSDGTLVPVKNPIFEKLYAAYLEDRGEVSQYQDPEFGFEEWYADKFAAEMFNFLEGKKPKNVIESFFHRIIKKLQEFYRSLGAEAQKRFGQVPPEFQQYMQNVRDIFKQNLTPQKVSRPAKAYYEARKSTIEAATIFNNIGQATKQGVNKIVSTYKNKSAREIWGLRYLLYPTDNLMKYFEKKNPQVAKAIRTLREQMYTRSKEKAGSTPAYLNAHAKRNNSFFTQFLNIFDLSNTKYLSPTEKENMNEVLKIAEDFETNPFNVLAEKAKANPTSAEGRAHRVRLYLKNFHKAFLEPLGIPFNQKYFPRAIAIFEIINDPSKQDKLVELLTEYNQEALQRNPQLNFRKVVDKLLSEDEATLDEVDENEGDLTDLAVGGNRRRQQYFKKIPSSALREAGLLKDATEGMREYLNSMAKRIQYNESFVVNVRSISPEAKSILKSKGIVIKQTEADAGVVTGWKALEANLAEIEAVDPKLEAKVRHIVRGQLGKAGQDMSAGFRNTNSFLLFFNAVTLLTLAPLASFPDLAGPMIHGGDFKGFSDGVNFAKTYAFGGKEGRERARQFALDLGVIAADSLSLYYINAAEQNYMNPMFKKGTDYFFRFTGLEAYTQFTRIFAAQMGKQFIIRAAEGAKKGDKLYAEQLDALGVTPEQVEAAQADDFVLTGKLGRKHVAVRSALGKFVDESIVRPNAAERPGWANNPYFATVWQLKSFYYAYGKTIVGGIGRTIQQRYGAEGIPSAMVPAIMGAALLLPLTALGLEIRELVKFTLSGFDASKFRTNRLDWSSYMGELIDRAGVLGPFGLLIPMYESQKYGDFFLGPALGPSFERVEDLLLDGEVKQNIPVFGTLI